MPGERRASALDRSPVRWGMPGAVSTLRRLLGRLLFGPPLATDARYWKILAIGRLVLEAIAIGLLLYLALNGQHIFDWRRS